MHYSYWVIRSAEGPVVIDTGFAVDEAYWAGDAVHRPVPETLDAIGLDPRDVRHLVLTHYHFDHAGHVDLFPNAIVHSSAAEHAAWSRASTDELAEGFVDPRHVAQIARVEREGRLRLLPDAPTPIAGGACTVPAPGHTPGQLAVVVQTPSGTRILAADAVHFAEQLEERWDFFAHGDPAEARRSVRMLTGLRDRTGGLLIPGHEPAVREEFPADPRAPGFVSVLG
jgi:glyoxylase-like metal-dependent hydrolase (beta-lactamase superfamily II)